MRKNKIFILCLMFIAAAFCQAQRLDIKPYSLYNQSVSSQVEPVFHYAYLDMPSHMTELVLIFPVSSLSKNFTLANGLEYGFAIDYTFRNQLGFELGLGYFSSMKTSFSASKQAFISANTDWKYRSFVARPLFTYTVTNKKSTFIGKTGPTIHYTSATINASYGSDNEKLSVCRFANQLNLGYLIALEYNYQLSGRFSLAIELGLEQYKYTPGKATVEYGSLIQKKYEIQYVNEIVNELISFQYPSFQYPSFQNSSQSKQLKESVLFNSIYFGIGIKYNLWKK